MKVVYEGKAQAKMRFYYEDSAAVPQNLSEKNLFKGGRGEIFWELSGEELFIHAGLGKRKEVDAFSLLKTGISCMAELAKKWKGVSVVLDFADLSEETVFFLIEGFCLEGFYRYPFKRKLETTKISELIVFTPHREKVEKAKNIAESRNWVRELVDTPSNVLVPMVLAERIRETLEAQGVKVEIWDRNRLEEEDMHGLIYVGKGSVYPPCLVLHYHPENPRFKITLVGKGITFDFGGLSLKSTESMLNMKGDMAWAASMA